MAQVLSCAGYLQGPDPEQPESQIPGKPVLAAVQAGDQQHAVNAEDFPDGLARSLAEGSFRLVIVLDSAPDELVQVVGYLQPITDNVDIDLVTMSAYEVAGSQVLVPQQTGPGRRSRQMSEAQAAARQAGVLYRGSAEFRSVIADLHAAKREPLVRLADRADTREQQGLVKLATFRGKDGQMTTLLPHLAADDAGLVTIYCDGALAYLQLFRSVFERRAPHSLPAAEAAMGGEIRQGNTTRNISDTLLAALTDAYREAVGEQQRTT